MPPRPRVPAFQFPRVRTIEDFVAVMANPSTLQFAEKLIKARNELNELVDTSNNLETTAALLLSAEAREKSTLLERERLGKEAGAIRGAAEDAARRTLGAADSKLEAIDARLATTILQREHAEDELAQLLERLESAEAKQAATFKSQEAALKRRERALDDEEAAHEARAAKLREALQRLA